jgi:hypothetical protein
MDIAFIITLIQAGIKLAPDVIEFYAKAKRFIDSLFARGAIDAETQAKVRDFVDACQTAALSNQPPPHWTVEPDPS